jgi:hypothetical protein
MVGNEPPRSVSGKQVRSKGISGTPWKSSLPQLARPPSSASWAFAYSLAMNLSRINIQSSCELWTPANTGQRRSDPAGRRKGDRGNPASRSAAFWTATCLTAIILPRGMINNRHSRSP